jgi:hypothetical protein
MNVKKKIIVPILCIWKLKRLLYIDFYWENMKNPFLLERSFCGCYRARRMRDKVCEGPISLVFGDGAIHGVEREILQEFGYKVIEAVDGKDALDKFRKDSERIQLVLLDVIMASALS